MKKLLLLFVIAISASAVSAQYQGTPWNGTPWTFGEDSAANMRVGTAIESKKPQYFNGVPHLAYDIGVVDTTKRAADDPDGTLVAGSGVAVSEAANDDWRTPNATDDGITLDQSDLDAMASPNFGGVFSSHDGRSVTGKSGGWYRYTCNFSKNGNYKMLIRVFAHDDNNYAAWIRFYDKATMDPIYPWTYFNHGSSNLDATGVSYVDLTSETFDTTRTNKKVPASPADKWVELDDAFTLDGDVVVEYCDPGPSEAYGDNTRGSGSGSFGEFVFFYTGEASDEYAPVAEPFKFEYDDMEDFSLTLSEAGTLYLVPAGTAIEDVETANIDKMEMTTDDTYTKDLAELDLPDTIQIVTMDAAQNSRISDTIVVEKAFTVETTQGETNDTIFFNTTRSGYVALVPSNVDGTRTALELAIATGNADTVNVTGGNDTMVISTLTGDLDCNLFLVDEINDQVSYAIAFQLGEGGSPAAVIQKSREKVTVSARYDEIMVRNIAEYNTVRIYDILGKEHIRQHVNSSQVQLDASAMRSGVYILKLSGDNGTLTKKFLLSK